jgi:predicted site-specific integrase-resolvase
MYTAEGCQEELVSEPTGDYLGIGLVAKELGVSRSAVRRWEERGWIEPAPRLAGSARRVFRVVDLETIRQRVSERRAAARQRGGPERAA